MSKTENTYKMTIRLSPLTEFRLERDYRLAHGIASMIDGNQVIIGSTHFVFEDEGCTIPEEEQARYDALPEQYSHLYLAIGGVLAAVICISDPLRGDRTGERPYSHYDQGRHQRLPGPVQGEC